MFYLTIKDEEGVIRPQAILCKNDKYGMNEVVAFAKKDNLTIVLVEIKEVKEIKNLIK